MTKSSEKVIKKIKSKALSKSPSTQDEKSTVSPAPKIEAKPAKKPMSVSDMQKLSFDEQAAHIMGGIDMDNLSPYTKVVGSDPFLTKK